MSSLDIEQANSLKFDDQSLKALQKFNVGDSALFDLMKNSNFEEFNEVIRQFKNLNILQESSNSPDSNKQSKQSETQGKENIEILRPLKPEKKYISEVIEMDICENQKTIDFGTCLPGHVLEEALVLRNIGNQSYKIKVTVLCYDDELNDLDEYVFSIRKEDDFEYNESQLCKVSNDESLQLFVALKVPNLKMERKINGIIQVKVIGGGLCGLLEKPISALIKIPKIICLKELYSTDYKQSVIKLAMKLSNTCKAECKVPFKNLGKSNVKAEFELIYDKKRNDDFEFSLNPEFGLLPTDNMFMIGLIGKKIEQKSPVRNRNSMRSQLFSQLEKITSSKKKKIELKQEKNVIILVKIINSSVIICYPTIIEIY